jgi:H+-transporting ATPase
MILHTLGRRGKAIQSNSHEEVPSRGLTTDEAVRIREEYGLNEIPEKKKNPILAFLRYFWGPIPWMIEIASILSAFLQRWEDFSVIVALMFLNAIVGFWQEHKADNAIELIKQKLAHRAKVFRDQKWIEIDARDLVPGDFVRVRLGDIVPADIKLDEGEYLQIDQSALTGESLPVEKSIGDMAFSGSVIRQGEMNGTVTETGVKTYFGKTTKLVAEAKVRSHFQKAVIKIGDYLIALALVLVTVIFIAALFRGESFLDTLQFALVLIIAAIPVALPAVLTVTLAIGATSLAKREAIVSRLVSIEELAGLDVLCADKTGTITKNEIRIAEIAPFDGYTIEDVLIAGALASREENRDPIDDAILAAANTEFTDNKMLRQHKVLAFKPFDPVSKRTEATIEAEKRGTFKVAKGAPQIIWSLVQSQMKSEDIGKHVDAYAAKGYRSLGVAQTDSDGTWQVLGVIALYDPPREDSRETIESAAKMGVQVKMLTGDHSAVAKEIAKEVGLGTNIVPASTLLNKSDIEATRIIDESNGFAEVFPENKYHIVELLQAENHIVGMTGDGVNDAPALKRADAGVAVAGATDAAKSAADIVLTSPGLSVIIDAIKESRKIFRRMENYSVYRIAETIRIIIFLTLSILIFNFYPITALMIVLLAILNDAPIMMIAYDNAAVGATPVRWEMRRVVLMAFFFGLIGVVSSFSLFWIGDVVFALDRNTIQTLIFLKLTVAGHMTIYNTRTKDKHFWTRPFPSLSLVGAAETTQVIGTIIAVYGLLSMAPLGWSWALFVWGYSILFFVIADLLRMPMVKLLNHSGIRFSR